MNAPALHIVPAIPLVEQFTAWRATVVAKEAAERDFYGTTDSHLQEAASQSSAAHESRALDMQGDMIAALSGLSGLTAEQLRAVLS